VRLAENRENFQSRLNGAAGKQSSFKQLYGDGRKRDIILQLLYSAPCHPDIFLCGDYLDFCI
jgi:hypothetical protein